MTAPPRTLLQALDDAAETDQGIVFLVNGAERRRSYEELRRRALRVAIALDEVGLRRGDVVALAIDDAELFLTALIGASMAGLIPASLAPPAATADVPAYIGVTAAALRTSRARAIVASGTLVPSFDALRAGCPHLDFVLARETLESDGAPRVVSAALDDIVFVQFTSGSTSDPKGVALTHANLAANIEAINGPSGLATGPDDSAVSWLPLHHDMGLVGMALGPLYTARPAVLMTPQAFVKRPADWLQAISDYRATVSFAPNFAYDLVVRRVRDRDLEGLDLSRWRVAGCGAEPIHASTLAAFASRLEPARFRPDSFLPCYGLAEHVLAATLSPRDRPLRMDGPLVSCGKPLPGHHVRIVGDDGLDAGGGEVGEVTLAGPSVMLGYYNDPGSTTEAVHDGWLRTGDLGYLCDGELFVCGRVKDIIIANGRKYHPQDLEWALDDVEGIRRGRAVAFGVPERDVPGARDRVVIVVEAGRTRDVELLAQAIRRRIAEAFGLYVDDVETAPGGTIERTTSGKLRRAAAKAWFEQRRRL